MKAVRTLFLAAALLCAAGPADSQSTPAVSAAVDAGIVGERYDGYLGLAAAAGEDVRRQVSAMNIKRRSLYTSLAARRRVTLQAVGIAAGCELLATVEVGQAFMLQDGEWRTRAPGEAAPVPGYCTR